MKPLLHKYSPTPPCQRSPQDTVCLAQEHVLVLVSGTFGDPEVQNYFSKTKKQVQYFSVKTMNLQS